MTDQKLITVKTTVHASVEKAWRYWTEPEHITKWNAASEDWNTPFAQNDLRAGGQFLYRMESKDGKYGFDFVGTYHEIIPHKTISYTLADGREVEISFESEDDETTIVETFAAESTYSLERQQEGWQAILDHFKRYIEM